MFRYQHAEPFTFLGSPLWLNFAWIFGAMLYLHYLPQGEEWHLFPLYILTFSIAGAALDMVYKTGILEYITWNPFYRFIIAMFRFYGVTLHSKALASKAIQDKK